MSTSPMGLPAAHRRAVPGSVHEGFPLARAITAIAGMGGSGARILHRINDFTLAAAAAVAGIAAVRAPLT